MKTINNNQLSTNSSPIQVKLSSNIDKVSYSSKAILTFSFSDKPIGFGLEDIKVTDGTVTNLVQAKTDQNIFTADFTWGVNTKSPMSTIKLDGIYTDALGVNGTPSNTVTIKNDISAIGTTPTVGFTSNNASMTEGNSGIKPFNFTVKLSQASTEHVIVNYTTELKNYGSAKANTDYIPVTSSLDFAPGETSKILSVNVIGDTTYEANENFYVDLTSAKGASIVTNGAEGLRNSWATGYINNDDILGNTGKTSGILGTISKDTLGGTSIGDLIDGKGGADNITGYAGDDIFSFAKSYASITIDGSALITDFKDGFDLIGLQGDLTFDQLYITHGIGEHVNDTIISLVETGAVLVSLVGVPDTSINGADFVHTDFFA